MLEDYCFISKFNYIPGKETMCGTFSTLFLLTKNNTNFICKRVKFKYYNENEWKIPKDIGTNRVIEFTDVVKETYNNTTFIYMISPYNDEEDLFNHIEKLNRTVWLEKELLSYLLEMCTCVQDVHAKNCVHLDIKPENFIVQQFKEKSPLKLKLIDFGFSRHYYSMNENRLASRVGSPVYIAPEVLKYRRYSPKSDVYSLGVCAIFILFPAVFDVRDNDDIKKTSYFNHLLRQELNHYTDRTKELLMSMLKVNDTMRASTVDVIREITLLLSN